MDRVAEATPAVLMATRVARVVTHNLQTTATLRAQPVLTRWEILKDQVSEVARVGLSSHRTTETRQEGLTGSLETQNHLTTAEQILTLMDHRRVTETLRHQYRQRKLNPEHRTHTQMLGLKLVQAILATLTTPTIYQAPPVPVTQQGHLLLTITVTQILTEALIKVAKKSR